MDCAGIVLTGGTSRRLGFDKAVVTIGGETLAARAARVLSAVCSPVIEVGPGHTGLATAREELPGSGPLAALVAGAGAVAADRVLLLACDLVRVEAPLLRLLADWDGAPTAIPVVGGRRQLVCARYGSDALAAAPRLLASGERSLRALVELLDVDDVGAEAWASLADADAFADLDTPADLKRLGLQAP